MTDPLESQVERLSPRSGDLLVLRCPGESSDQMRNQLADVMNEICEHHGCRGVVIPEGFRIHRAGILVRLGAWLVNKQVGL